MYLWIYISKLLKTPNLSSAMTIFGLSPTSWETLVKSVSCSTTKVPKNKKQIKSNQINLCRLSRIWFEAQLQVQILEVTGSGGLWEKNVSWIQRKATKSDHRGLKMSSESWYGTSSNIHTFGWTFHMLPRRGRDFPIADPVCLTYALHGKVHFWEFPVKTTSLAFGCLMWFFFAPFFAATLLTYKRGWNLRVPWMWPPVSDGNVWLGERESTPSPGCPRSGRTIVVYMLSRSMCASNKWFTTSSTQWGLQRQVSSLSLWSHLVNKNSKNTLKNHEQDQGLANFDWLGPQWVVKSWVADGWSDFVSRRIGGKLVLSFSLKRLWKHRKHGATLWLTDS